MQGTNRHLVNPAVSSREAFAELDARNEADPVYHTPTGLLDEGAVGVFHNTGARPATFIADRNVVIEIEPAAAATSVILWTWTKASTSCCFVVLDSAEAVANAILKQVASQRLRQDNVS